MAYTRVTEEERTLIYRWGQEGQSGQTNDGCPVAVFLDFPRVARHSTPIQQAN